jgi:ligand-binding sensor protein
MSNTDSKNSKIALQTMQEEFVHAKDLDVIILNKDGSDVGVVGLKNA